MRSPGFVEVLGVVGVTVVVFTVFQLEIENAVQVCRNLGGARLSGCEQPRDLGVIVRKPRFWPVRGRHRGRPHENRDESTAKAHGGSTAF